MPTPLCYLLWKKFAEELGLTVETLNPAGLYFLEKITDYRDCLVVLKRGKQATVYRPNVSLYLRLKLKRFSESDCSDCLAFLRYAKKAGEEIDARLLIREIQKELKQAGIQEARDGKIA